MNITASFTAGVHEKVYAARSYLPLWENRQNPCSVNLRIKYNKAFKV